MQVPVTEAEGQLTELVRQSAAGKPSAGPGAARSQDFLYGGDGLPR